MRLACLRPGSAAAAQGEGAWPSPHIRLPGRPVIRAGNACPGMSLPLAGTRRGADQLDIPCTRVPCRGGMLSNGLSPTAGTAEVAQQGKSTYVRTHVRMYAHMDARVCACALNKVSQKIAQI